MIELIFLKVLILIKCKETSRESSLCKFYYFLYKSMDHIYVMIVMICL